MDSSFLIIGCSECGAEVQESDDRSVLDVFCNVLKHRDDCNVMLMRSSNVAIGKERSFGVYTRREFWVWHQQRA